MDGEIALVTSVDSNGQPIREPLKCTPLTRPNFKKPKGNSEADIGVYNQITGNVNATSIHSNFDHIPTTKSRMTSRLISMNERLEPISGKLLMKQKRTLLKSSKKTAHFKCDDEYFYRFVVDEKYTSQPDNKISLKDILTIAPRTKTTQFYIEIADKPTLIFTVTDLKTQPRDWWVSELNKRWKNCSRR